MTSKQLPKLLRYEDPFFENTGEPRVQLLEPHRGKAGFYKHASQEVNDYLSTVESCPGKRYVLVLAMSAGEYYGPNRNGDAFAESPVKIKGEWAVAPGETLIDHYKTFETHGCCYRHHINKDPNKKLGDIVKAFYNHKMHRVELLLEVDEDRGNDIVRKLDCGEFPGVSMGCRIRYDVCNICGNQAPTRDQYCEHVNGLNPEFGMNQLLPDGRKCFVWNPSPTLFDISFVFKPADRIGYTMQKVAYSSPYELKLSADLGNEVERLTDKRAALQKLSDIDKIIHGEVVDVNNAGLGPSELNATKSLVKNIVPRVIPKMEELPETLLQNMAQHSLPKILSSMNACGMVPTSPEIYYVISCQQGLKPRRDIASRIASTQGILADILSAIPQVFDIFEERGLTKVSEALVDNNLVDQISPYTEKRALWSEYVAQKYIPETPGVMLGEATGAYDPNRAYYTPSWEPLHFRDQGTGRTYQTTSNAARSADWDNKKKSLIEGAGMAALTGIAAKSLGANRKWQWLAPAAVGAGVTGGRELLRQHKVPGVDTVEGVRVPANTEFVEKRSSLAGAVAKKIAPTANEYGVPLAGGALLTFLLAQDRLGSEDQLEDLKSFAKERPEMTAVIGAGSISGGRHGLRRLRSQFKHAMMDLTKTAEHDPQELPKVSFDELVHTVGKFIVDG